MSLKDYKEKSKKHWHHLADELTEIMATFGCPDKIYLNRLNRLRAGHQPTKHEVRALLILTRNKEDSFKD